ncbi:MAG: hypothetical protein GY862_37135 [Gammaproteobacteria bacterium]|nr:hypothetical protein [Gammaproteobacteria bacterium]
MINKRQLAFFTAYLLGILAAGCSSVPPTQEMSDARQAIQAVRNIGAVQHIPFSVYHAEEHMAKAEEELARGVHAYDYARFNALAAKKSALQAHEVVRALDRAKAAVQAAGQSGPSWKEAQALFEQAKTAARQGNAKKALSLAEQARKRGNSALNQAHLQRANLLIQGIKPREATLALPQTTLLEAAKAAVLKKQGKKAIDLMRALMKMLQ